jgi:phosphoglycerate dehydrogenase-like enzyme
MMKLLVASDEGQDFFTLLESVPGLEIEFAWTADEIASKAADIDVFYGKPTNELLTAAPKLKWVQTPSAGVDFILSMPEFIASDIILTNTKGAHAPSIAEHTFALLLSLTRAIVPASIDWQRQKFWGRVPGYRIPKEIMGSTIGIIGFGQIGRAIAQRAAGFGMQIRAVDIVAGSGAPYCEEVWPVGRLHEMLSGTDVVALAAPYTPGTHHLLDAAAFASMPPGGYVIAVSRGGIIDETALIASLQSGHLAGAGLDVCEKEPLPADSPLWELPNVVISPHLAGSSSQKERRCVEILVDNLGRFGRGEPLVNVVDKQLGY